MANIPQFAFPFRIADGEPAVNEQGSIADVAACVTAICLTRPGDLMDAPTFGLPDPTFTQEPLRADELLNPISVWEPRAKLLAEISPAAYDVAIENVNIDVEA